MSAAQLEDLAKSLGKHGPRVSINISAYRGARAALFREVVKQWGLLDPEAAALCMASHELGGGSDILEAWMERAPGEAEAWAFSGDIEGAGKQNTFGLRLMILAEKGLNDFEEALDLWEKVDGRSQRITLRNWSELLTRDPEKRNLIMAKIANLPDKENRLLFYGRIVADLATSSPHEAAELTEGLAISDEEKTSLTGSWIGGWAEKKPEEALAFWATLNEAEAPPAIGNAVHRWAIIEPEKVVTWIDSLPAGTAKETLREQAVTSLANTERHRSAADMCMKIEDPEQRMIRLKTVLQDWRRRYADSANHWILTLPEEERVKLMDL